MLTNNSNFKWVSQSLVQFGSKPEWKLMCRPVKKLLLKQLGEKRYNNIHDPRFYQDLETRWQASKEFFADVLLHDQANVECAVCLETYKVTDKVTTLMCGHKFCSSCILQHMCRHGGETQCPLCRKGVFCFDVYDNVRMPLHQEENVVVDVAVQRKREKRRLERMRKRQRKKENKN